MQGRCEQCGAPLLDEKCSRDGDFDFDTDQQAYGALVHVYVQIYQEQDAEALEAALAHDLDEELANRVRASVMAFKGYALAEGRKEKRGNTSQAG